MRGQLAEWLERKFAEWQPSQDRKHRSLRAFASYLGISQPLLVQLINATRTSVSPDTADIIAARLGYEIYNLVGLPRPDPDLARIKELWPRVNEERRAYIVQVAEKAAGNGSAPETSVRTVAPSRKAGT